MNMKNGKQGTFEIWPSIASKKNPPKVARERLRKSSWQYLSIVVAGYQHFLCTDASRH